MAYTFVPKALQQDADVLLSQLKQLTLKPDSCPYCQQTAIITRNSSCHYYFCKSCKKSINRTIGTPFYRLSPLEWLPIIAKNRLEGKGFAAIRDIIEDETLTPITSKRIKLRVKAIESLMKAEFPALFAWYQNFIKQDNKNPPEIVTSQAQQLRGWLTTSLTTNHANCIHCGSDKTHKIGTTRANFRCHRCWRYFSLFSRFRIKRFRHIERWQGILDMILNGATNVAMQQQFGIHPTTARINRRAWYLVMKQQKLNALQMWLN